MKQRFYRWFVTPRFPGGYSCLGALNIIALQWFFVRLQASGSYDGQTPWSFKFIGFIVPLTGWYSKYVWVHRWSE